MSCQGPAVRCRGEPPHRVLRCDGGAFGVVGSALGARGRGRPRHGRNGSPSGDGSHDGADACSGPGRFDCAGSLSSPRLFLPVDAELLPQPTEVVGRAGAEAVTILVPGRDPSSGECPRPRAPARDDPASRAGFEGPAGRGHSYRISRYAIAGARSGGRARVCPFASQELRKRLERP